MKVVNIYLLRHGALEKSGVLAGHTDLELSELGWQQMLSAVEPLNITKCFSSSLKRCYLFAQQFCQQESLDLNVDDALKEMNFGKWDGLSYEELWQKSEPNIGHFWQNPEEVTPPGGETFAEFNHRIRKWWLQLIDHPEPNNILVISHAGVIKQIMALVIDESSGHSLHSKFNVMYGSVVHIQLSFDEFHQPWPVIML